METVKAPFRLFHEGLALSLWCQAENMGLFLGLFVTNRPLVDSDSRVNSSLNLAGVEAGVNTPLSRGMNLREWVIVVQRDLVLAELVTLHTFLLMLICGVGMCYHRVRVNEKLVVLVLVKN